MNLLDVFVWTQELAKEAAAYTATLRKSGFAVEQKRDGTLVSEIDRKLETFLREAITARFPDHAILGEEFGRDAAADPDAPLWAIDPIDGTTNLAHGLPQWGTSIGLVHQGVAVVGVATFPELGQTFAGARGHGATLNGEPLPALPPGGAFAQEETYGICTASVHAINFDKFPGRLRLAGSAALDLCWTAAGFLRGSQSVGVKLYDVAAGLVFCHEVGADSAWLRSGAPLDVAHFAANAPIKDDILLTAPPATLRYLRETLRAK